MKTIGLIGGMSWESTATYYKLINEQVKQRLGALHSAKIVLWSFDFEEIAALQKAGDWQGATALISDAALKLKLAGADALIICTNTMHVSYPQVQDTVQIPVLHIADATAREIKKQGFQKIGLVATRFTMEQQFYTGWLQEHYGIETIVPDQSSRNQVHRIIFDELCKGIILDSSRDKFVSIIEEMVANGAEAILLGCTEIGMLICQKDISVTIFDSTILHANTAADFVLN